MNKSVTSCIRISETTKRSFIGKMGSATTYEEQMFFRVTCLSEFDSVGFCCTQGYSTARLLPVYYSCSSCLC